MRWICGFSLIGLIVLAGCDSSSNVDTDRQADTIDRPDGEFNSEPSAQAFLVETYGEEEGANLESYDFDFELPSTEGKTVRKADFAGKVLVADIWATWCGPCRIEVPHFVELQEELGDEGLAMVGLNYESADSDEEAIETIADFTADTPVNYPLLLGDEETAEQVPNFLGYPTTIFMDRSGKVRLTLVGARPKDELEKIVKSLLAE